MRSGATQGENGSSLHTPLLKIEITADEMMFHTWGSDRAQDLLMLFKAKEKVRLNRAGLDELKGEISNFRRNAIRNGDIG